MSHDTRISDFVRHNCPQMSSCNHTTTTTSSTTGGWGNHDYNNCTPLNCSYMLWVGFNHLIFLIIQLGLNRPTFSKHFPISCTSVAYQNVVEHLDPYTSMTTYNRFRSVAGRKFNPLLANFHQIFHGTNYLPSYLLSSISQYAYSSKPIHTIKERLKATPCLNKMH